MLHGGGEIRGRGGRFFAPGNCVPVEQRGVVHPGACRESIQVPIHSVFGSLLAAVFLLSQIGKLGEVTPGIQDLAGLLVGFLPEGRVEYYVVVLALDLCSLVYGSSTVGAKLVVGFDFLTAVSAKHTFSFLIRRFIL